MKTSPKALRTYAGFSMIEVLVTLIILMVGLLGIAGMMVQGQRSEVESYQRVQAIILLQDMQNRINTNRKVAGCYAFTTNTTNGTPFLGTGSTITPTCGTGTAAQNSRAAADLATWDSLLKGAAETSGGNTVGAMVGARGCVSYDATTALTDPTTGATLPGTGLYTVAVAWQGLSNTFVASPNCAQGQYGANDASRRVVSATLRIGALAAP